MLLRDDCSIRDAEGVHRPKLWFVLRYRVQPHWLSRSTFVTRTHLQNFILADLLLYAEPDEVPSSLARQPPVISAETIL